MGPPPSQIELRPAIRDTQGVPEKVLGRKFQHATAEKSVKKVPQSVKKVSFARVGCEIRRGVCRENPPTEKKVTPCDFRAPRPAGGVPPHVPDAPRHQLRRGRETLPSNDPADRAHSRCGLSRGGGRWRQCRCPSGSLTHPVWAARRRNPKSD